MQFEPKLRKQELRTSMEKSLSSPTSGTNLSKNTNTFQAGKKILICNGDG